MTPELNNVIKTLNENIRQIKELHTSSVVENIKLKENITKLLVELEQKESEHRQLETKYESLKLAKVIATSTTDSHDAKIKLNRIVREIDKCISLLNK
jgi:N-acetylmuramic acid 6-phosphate (MurNAc-6-P) etherase